MLERVLGFSKVLGVIFLALVVGAVYLTYAIFTKQFTSYDKVTLQASSIGLQLPKRADIKIRGVIVGEVLDYTANDQTANITLGIYPDQIDQIPADVSASILPKTLFGEKYVALDVPRGEAIPSGSSGDHLQPGATITQSAVSTEVEAVLNDLYPLLRTVQPAQLNMTLNAVSTALQGRGNQLGQTIETADAYLKRLNPQIPGLLRDLRKTVPVADNYADVLPQVGQILDNTVTTTQTLQSRQEKVRQLFTDVASLSDTTRSFLSDNEQNIVDVSNLSATQLRIAARYSTEFPCLFRGIVGLGKRATEAFRGFELHIVLETIPSQPRAYTAADQPVYGERRGPNCLHLPNPPWSQSNPVKRFPNFNDGVNTPTGKGTDRVAPFSGAAYRPAGSGYAGSQAETDLYRRLLAPGLGKQPHQVGDLGALLVGPMARGAEVSLR